MRIANAAILAAMIALSSAPALAEPATTETIHTYAVTGASPRDIRADINRERVKPEAVGTTFDSVTRWRVNWRFDVAPSDAGCAIAAVRTTVIVTIIMPELTGDAPADVQARFKTYYDNLLLHERGHGKTALDTAREIEAALAALPPAPTCPQAREAANALGRSLIEKAHDRDIAYDAETRHGMTQGTRFP